MNIVYPDYDRSVLSITNSILTHYGINPYHKTLPELDNIFEKNFRNIVFIIFDGLGSGILEKHLDDSSFMHAHKSADISSVFPPTTTASTIAMHTGLSPIEHGWLGWRLYFKEIDMNVDVFPNIIGETKDTPAADYNVALKYIPYDNIFDKISTHCKGVQAEFVAPFSEHRVNSIAEISETVRQICGLPGRHFLLTYWNNPDTDMHEHGTESDIAHAIICDINQQIELLSEHLSDTVLIITADHGQIDTEYRYITDYPAISECLLRPQSIESRAANFFVKPEKKEQFKTAFNRQFGNDFMLLTKEQVLDRKLFGNGIPHKKVDDFIGDFLAIAVGNISIDHARPTYRDVFIGQHAGLTEDEMTVPLIIIEK